MLGDNILSGKPLCEIERALGGDPDSEDEAATMCPRSRELVGTVVPRGLSFIVGLVSHVVEQVDPFGQQEELDRQVIECLGSAVRKGYDTPANVFLSTNMPAVLSRVQIHAFALRQKDLEERLAD